MAESYSVKARLSAVDSGFGAMMKNAIGLTSSFKDTVASIGTGILQGVGQQIFSLVSTSIGDMTGELNSNNAAWKTFEGNMGMLKKSPAEIAAVRKELEAFAADTIYNASDMSSTFAQLAVVGVKNTTELVKGFGGLASAAENPQQAMKTLSQQATQMAAKPKVAWADFKLMLEQTPAGLAQVAKAMDMTTAELVASVQSGTVATEDFFDAIIQAAGSGTELNKLARQYKTVDQAVDGLKETVATKLSPTFSLFTDLGIKGVSGLIGKLDDLDGDAIADKVSGWIEDAMPLWNSFQKAVGKTASLAEKAAEKLSPLFSGLGTQAVDAVQGLLDAVGAMDVDAVLGKVGAAVEKAKPYWDTFVEMFQWASDMFQAAAPPVLSALSAIGDFLLDNSDTLSQAIPYILLAVGAFKGFQIIGTLLPGVRGFASSMTSLTSGGIKGLAEKLFGVGQGASAAGTSCQASSIAMLQGALATLALGAAVLFAALGIGLLVQSAIALAGAGWPAVGALVALVGVVALLAFGAVSLGAGLTAAAPGLLAFGGAIALVGVGAVLAGAGLLLMANALPLIAAYGSQAAGPLMELSGGLAVFAIGAALAAVPLAVLSAGLLVVSVAMVAFGVGALLAAASLAIMTPLLPQLSMYGMEAAASLLALGGALVVFGAGAIVAGAGLLMIAADFLVASAAVLVLSAAVLVVAASFLVLSAGALVTAVSLLLVAGILPTIAQYGTDGAAALTLLGAGMVVFAVGAGLAGVSAAALSVGIVALTVSITAFGLALLGASPGVLLLGASLLAVSGNMKSIASSAGKAESSLLSMERSVSIVESGLDALGGMAKDAVSTLISVFGQAVGDAEQAGEGIGSGMSQGLSSGLALAVPFAVQAVMVVNATLLAGVVLARQAGVETGRGYADGMLSQLSNIQAAAGRMVAAANRGITTAAQIHSPSKVTDDFGTDYGLGYVNGVSRMVKDAWKASEKLVTIPHVDVPDMESSYSGELSAEHRYTNSSEYVIQVPLTLDGRELARANVKVTQEELDRQQTRDSRKHGVR